ncbi:MAG: hypothetical protein ACP5IE_09225, partial [Infirmifilum sp.]
LEKIYEFKSSLDKISYMIIIPITSMIIVITFIVLIHGLNSSVKPYDGLITLLGLPGTIFSLSFLILALASVMTDLKTMFKSRLIGVAGSLLSPWGIILLILIFPMLYFYLAKMYNIYTSYFNEIIYISMLLVYISTLLAYIGISKISFLAIGVENVVIDSVTSQSSSQHYDTMLINITNTPHESSETTSSYSDLSELDIFILDKFRAGESLAQIARERGVSLLEVQDKFIKLLDKGLVEVHLNQVELQILERARSGINVKELAEQMGMNEEVINWEIGKLKEMALLDQDLKLTLLGYHILTKQKTNT